ncbi:MAG TPA: FAD-binding oxidoreductase [Chloroflexota bacterium]|jgi:glycolate oxidase FAD binding subunit
MAQLASSVSIDGVTASESAQPSTAEELAEALHAADTAGKAVAPIGGGTHLALGMPPERVDLALHTGKLQRVVEYEPADLTVTVEAGIRFADLQAQLAEQGQFLALDPSVDEASTIGGVLATNASGPLRFAYGTARDLVIGTRVANPDGTLTRSGGRVVKNVAGYDLNKLYIGSLGTLGITVEVSFKLAPIPPASATVVGAFASLDDMRGLAAAVVHSPLAPHAIELLAPGAAAAAGIGHNAVLVLRVGGYEAAVERQVRDLSALIAQHGGSMVETAPTVWDDLATLRRGQQPLLVKAAVPIAQSVAVVDLLQRELASLEPIVWAHAGNGVAYASCKAPSFASALTSLRRQVSALGDNASLVIHSCPTPLKGDVDVWGEPSASIALMRAIKAKLDPKRTLNPGRYLGGI